MLEEQIMEAISDGINLVIVESFLMYCNPRIESLLDKKVIVHLSQQECFRRRSLHNQVPISYFEEVLWPSFLKNYEQVLDNDNYYYVDGEQDINQVCSLVQQYINDELKVSTSRNTREKFNSTHNSNTTLDYQAILEDLKLSDVSFIPVIENHETT
eukprot:TRINITY_DN1311_c0_g2_i2.p1 TRINITY_DN1311_c0_g2~~TRINITY_DN1311_c0_g2_i2.p1  ORF type:complete len:156 (+),score=18.97 TRINITY_DN1311_c0_g2_i2:242-709(+)